MLRYWINSDSDPHCPEGYVGIVDEVVGGVFIYVLIERAETVLDLLLATLRVN